LSWVGHLAQRMSLRATVGHAQTGTAHAGVPSHQRDQAFLQPLALTIPELASSGGNRPFSKVAIDN